MLPGITIDVGAGALTFNAVTQDNGLSIVGITTTIPVLGASALVDLDGAALTAGAITLNAAACSLRTTGRRRPGFELGDAEGRVGLGLPEGQRLVHGRRCRHADDLYVHGPYRRLHERRLHVYRRGLRRHRCRRRGRHEGHSRERKRHGFPTQCARPRIPRECERARRVADHGLWQGGVLELDRCHCKGQRGCRH